MGLQSALIGHRLYFFCGVTSKGTLIRDLFFLDLSSSFNIANPPYALASTYDSSEFPGCLYSTGVVGGSNNATIVVFGGEIGETRFNTLYTIDTTVNPPKLSGKNSNLFDGRPRTRSTIYSVVSNGIMYYFGDDESGNDTTTYTLDTRLWSWSSNIYPNAPASRREFTATILPDGRILYIGGTLLDSLANIYKVE